MNDTHLLEVIATATILLIALYGAIFDPSSRWAAKGFAYTVMSGAGLWLVIVVIVAVTPRS